MSLPGRNGLNVNLTLYYDSAIWTIDPVNSTATLNADRDFPTYGFRMGYGMIEGPITNEVGTSSYLLTEPDGTKRELRFFASPNTYESFDNTFVDFNNSTLTLSRKDGTQWKYQAVTGTTFFVPIQIEDTNGNYITIAYNTGTGFNAQAINTITDTLDRVITFSYDPNTHLPLSITAPAFGGTGTTTVATFGYSQIALNYNYTLAVTDTVATGTTINVLTRCRYANGAGYNFYYGDWGMVKEVDQVSANGTVRNYEKYNFPAATTALSDAPTYTQKTIFDGVNTANWTYQVTKSGFLTSSFAVTDPTGTTTTVNLFTSGWQIGLASSVVVQSGATTLRTVTDNWTQDNTSVNYKTNPRIASEATTLNDTSQQSQVSFSYAIYGNVSQVQEFDYGLVLVRTTQTDYSTAYVSQHILDRPIQVRIYNGGGNLISRTDYAYDGGSLTAVTGAAQHDPNYGSTFTARGNLTLVTRYQNAAAASGAIVMNFTYDTLGNLLTAQVDCCQLEQWVYTSTTQFAYPDRIIRGPSTGPQLTTTQSYDFNTGLLVSQTDPNGQPTSFSYDVMKRITVINVPLGAGTTFGYDDLSAQPSTTRSTALDGTHRLVQVTKTDGLARNVQRQALDAAGTSYSISDAQYDALGRATAVSNPHGPSETPVWTTNSYDGLGRLTASTPPGTAGSYQYSYSGNTTTVTDPAGKQRRTYTDALGRLVRVDEPGYSDGTPGQGSVQIDGSEQSVQNCCADCTRCITTYDTGTVSITVNGFTVGASYGKTSTASTIAAALAGAFNNNANSPVTASASGVTVSLVSKQNGAWTNYSFSTGSATNDPTDFRSPSFYASPNSGMLTGGTDGTGANGSTPSISTPLVTLYYYDPLNNLTVIQQGVQQRSFAYDGLGRLTSAASPEAGRVSYTYTDFSAIATRTDARGVVTSYTYEGLNRLSQVSYNVGTTGVPATPTVSFYYDEGGAAANALGRLTRFTDGVGSESYQYDALGRVTALNKTLSSTTYSVGYQYNLASELTAVTYPSGRQVLQQLDAIGRLSQVQSGGVNYLSSVAYNSASLPTGMSFGNGVAASYGYNARLQLASLGYSNSSQTLFSLAYNYGTGNNGQVQSVTDSLDATKSTSYTYDAWARLKTAQNGQWGLSWTYDRYGNRKTQTVTAGTAPSNSVTPSPSTNRLTDPGYAYDPAGNMTSDGLNNLVYDAENRIVSSTSGGATSTYTYDGNGLRAQKVSGGATTVYIFSATKVIAEYVNGVAPSSPAREYIYSGSQLVAKLEGAATQYYHADNLSVRLTTDVTGTVIGQQGHYPFGESWYQSSTATKWQFTSYERDAESGNDYAVHRYDINRLGRFSVPDPIAGSTANPQSLDRYAYVVNDPVNWTDSLGLCPEGFHPATPQEAQAIVEAANRLVNQSPRIGYAPEGSPGRQYDENGRLTQCDCSNFVDISINEAGYGVPGGRAGTQQILRQEGPGKFFEPVDPSSPGASVSVGNVLLVTPPGASRPFHHEVLVSSVAPLQLLGSQSSTGPETIPGPAFQQGPALRNMLAQAKIYRICVSNQANSSGTGTGGGSSGSGQDPPNRLLDLFGPTTTFWWWFQQNQEDGGCGHSLACQFID